MRSPGSCLAWPPAWPTCHRPRRAIPRPSASCCSGPSPRCSPRRPRTIRWCWCSTTCSGPTARACPCCASWSPSSCPVCCVVAIYRSTELTPDHPLQEVLAQLHRLADPVRIDLGGLELPEVVALLEAAAGHELDADGVGLARALGDETAGNPFFVSEILRHLAETGQLRQEGERWTMAGDLARLSLPHGVRAVVLQRSGRLAPAAQQLLAVGAVVGREFDLGVVAEVAGVDQTAALAGIEEAVRVALVNEVAARPGRFSFAHAIVEHSLAGAQSAARRRCCTAPSPRLSTPAAGSTGRSPTPSWLSTGSRATTQPPLPPPSPGPGRPATMPSPNSRPTKRCAGTTPRSACSTLRRERPARLRRDPRRAGHRRAPRRPGRAPGHPAGGGSAGRGRGRRPARRPGRARWLQGHLERERRDRHGADRAPPRRVGRPRRRGRRSAVAVAGGTRRRALLRRRFRPTRGVRH